ncbi:hypothetical protein DFQ28_004612 [Apophysomyces sp. BC1034]|nr:hypothetical protein DFQ30_004519 [Apophysomyces sp. BC1015]KAG0180963.1 hypothetical protein DFQ29_009713 [Apophysomyces sp. BC1021]KAG0188606.1 hypothetical protein DFQ28_004612 [Apophysomyces sp. BC1034]
MGAQASKQATRQLPRKARPETLANIPRESPSQLRTHEPIAADIKTDFIEEDGRDPQLHKKLTELGPVNVEPTRTKMRPNDAMLRILHERQRIEDAESPSRAPTLPIDELFSILEMRKRIEPGEQQKTLQAIAAQHKFDTKDVATLFKYYNTIAVMPPASVEKGERLEAVWVTDKQDWLQAVRNAEKRNERLRAEKEAAMKDHHQGVSANDKPETLEQKRERQLQDLFDD